MIVPHYHDPDALGRCLVALRLQDYPSDRLEIIVGDNASPEGEAAIAELLGAGVKLVVVTARGAGPARNGAAIHAVGEVLAFTDCDCVPEPGWLREGVAALAQSDIVGGRVRVLVESQARMTATEAFEVEFAFDNEGYVKRKGFTVTANLFCSRALFERVGGFATGVSEDLEWSHRATAAGYSLAYAPGAVVGHPARRNWDELHRKWLRLNREAHQLYAYRRGGAARWFLRSCLLPTSIVIHAPRVLLSSKLETWRDRVGALGILIRLRLWRTVDALQLALR
ncbi:MAG: glycosyltransferase [Verrucomicrobiaceae bacterium]|nr:MAG: glycosyltransferase [Verrucomicrobiaceae bacterium]